MGNGSTRPTTHQQQQAALARFVELGCETVADMVVDGYGLEPEEIWLAKDWLRGIALTDDEVEQLRKAAFAIFDAIGFENVETLIDFIDADMHSYADDPCYHLDPEDAVFAIEWLRTNSEAIADADSRFSKIGYEKIKAMYLEGRDLDSKDIALAEDWVLRHTRKGTDPGEPIDADEDQHTDPNPNWPEPVDLWGNFEPPELPKGLLPPVIETFAFTEGDNMGCDPAGVAMAALTVAAAVIPDAVQLRMKPKSDSWKESARLWNMLVGNVSAKKTPVLNRTTRPIKKIDGDMYRVYVTQLEAYEDQLEEQKKSKQKDQNQKPLQKPQQQRARLEDTTIEAAQEVFAASPDGLLVLQDELSGWFGMMDRYNGSGAKDRGFWLQAFNGGEYIVNRIKRGSLYIQNLSACLLGGIQPDKIRETAADGVDDGLLQRSIPIIMRPATADRDETLDGPYAKYDELIQQLNSIYQPNTCLEFDSGAQTIRRELADKHLALMNCDAINKKFAAHIGKYDGIFGRLCIVFHCIENLNYRHLQNSTVTTPIISEQTARRVADFMHDFLLPHAVCFYAGVLGLSDDHESLTKVAEYILAKKLDKIDSRTVQRGNRHMRGMKKKNIEDVLDQLHAFGWINKVPNLNYGRVNPKVHVLFEARAKAAAARAAGIREAIATAIKGFKKGANY